MQAWDTGNAGIHSKSALTSSARFAASASEEDHVSQRESALMSCIIFYTMGQDKSINYSATSSPHKRMLSTRIFGDDKGLSQALQQGISPATVIAIFQSEQSTKLLVLNQGEVAEAHRKPSLML